MCKKVICLTALLVLAGMAGGASAELVAQWKLDEGGGTTAVDATGNGNDGTLEGNPTVVDGQFGQALSFDDSRVVIGASDTLTADFFQGSFTLSAWINPTRTGNTWQQVFRAVAASYNNDTLFLNNDGRLSWRGTVNGGWAGGMCETAPNVVPADQWTHVAVTGDGTNFRIYVNGALSQESAFQTTDGANTTYYIGGTSGGESYTGMVDDLRVYNHVLPENDIRASMENQGGAIVKAYGPDPKDGAMLEATWVTLMWRAGDLAVSHDLYIGDNLDDVNNGAEGAFAGNYATTDLIIGFAGYPVPGGLVPGTTYYWRIDEVNPDDPNSPWKGDVWSFWIPPRTAYSPAPADGARFVTEDVTLVWTGGFDAKLHTVYFGDNFDDVSNATGGLPQSAATFTPPGPLAKDTVYYWRVDEFDALATHKGDVWSFRTLPDIPVGDPALVGWWKLDEGQGSTALDWSGQNSHGTLSGNPEWVIGQDGGALKLDGNSWVDCGTPDILQVGQEITIACWINPTALGGERSFVGLNGAYSFKASGDHLRFTTPGILDHDADVAVISTGTWQHVAVTFQPDQTVVFYINGVEAHRMTGSAANVGSGPFRIGTNQWNERFTGMIDDLRVYDKVATAEEITLAMRGDPLVAWDASPANGSNPDIDSALPLGWQPGDNASQHDVYFGTDVDAVTDADASDATGVYRGRQNGTSFTPAEGVEWGGGPYYWRVDEVSNDGTIIKGRIWSFTVADFLLVDDFESYNDIEEGLPGSNLVYMTWADGFGIPTNGSTMGYAVAFQPTMETAIVHGGRQSAPMAYYNIGAAFSEVTRTLPAQDWTAHGVQELSLWFYGAATNTPGQLYVKVNGVKVNCTGDSGDLSVPQWRECVVDLAAVGTNLQSVTSLSIGVDGIGATGMLLLDDIRLYQARGQ